MKQFKGTTMLPSTPKRPLPEIPLEFSSPPPSSPATLNFSSPSPHNLTYSPGPTALNSSGGSSSGLWTPFTPQQQHRLAEGTPDTLIKGRVAAALSDSCKRGRPRADAINTLIVEGSSSPSSIKCNICKRVFPREKSLQVHKKGHTIDLHYRATTYVR